jgi:hypothetical protein
MLTAEDIARATGEPVRAVQRWLRRTLGPAPRGHHRRVDPAEVARLLAVPPEAFAGLLGTQGEAA